jgi:hypothetical protein
VRIRRIPRWFFGEEKLGRLAPETRLVALALRGAADDDGWFKAMVWDATTAAAASHGPGDSSWRLPFPLDELRNSNLEHHDHWHWQARAGTGRHRAVCSSSHHATNGMMMPVDSEVRAESCDSTIDDTSQCGPSRFELPALLVVPLLVVAATSKT